MIIGTGCDCGSQYKNGSKGKYVMVRIGGLFFFATGTTVVLDLGTSISRPQCSKF